MDSLLSNLVDLYPKAKISQPNKLFYKKFHHRITIFCSHRDEYRFSNYSLCISVRRLFDKDIVTTRSESRRSNIFVKDEQNLLPVLNAISLRLPDKTYISEICYDQKNNTKSTECLPLIKSMGFGYKVYIKTGYFYYTKQQKEKLLSLFQDNPEQFRIPRGLDSWLHNLKLMRYWYPLYFYVRDPSTVTFFQLANSELVHKVVEVVE